MTDVILFHPDIYELKLHFYVTLPLGLLRISTLLDKEGYKIKIIDQRINKKWKEDLKRELKKNPICIGITSMIGASILNGLRASRIVKKNSNVPVVWGGPQPTILPQITLENKYVDIVCEGEGETTFYELVKTLEKDKSLNKVKGIWFKNNGGKKYNGKRPFVDFNDIPNPPYHILNIKDYKRTSWHTKKFTFNIETSRGCIYRCNYCYNPIHYPCWRALKAERVIELLKNLIDDYNVKSFLFHDDNFGVNQKRVNKIMEGILKEKLDIEMGFQGIRVDTICKMKKSELDSMSKAGCKHIIVGVESGSPRILKLLHKGIKVEQTYAANKKLSKYTEIKPKYNLMGGFPTETIEELFMTMNTAIKLKKENPSAQITPIFLYVPWPGTKMYDFSIQHGFNPPKTLVEWGHIEWTSAYARSFSFPWLTDEFKKIYEKTLLVYLFANDFPILDKNLVVKIMEKFYRHIAKFRFYHNYYRFMPEYFLSKFIKPLI